MTATFTGEERTAWLAERRHGIGGSDAAAIVGLDPYRSALEVYLDKIGAPGPDVDSDAAQWGNRLEAVVAEHFADETGFEILPGQPMVWHPAQPFMFANVDRLLREPGADHPCALLEVKTTGAHLADRWTDGPPDRVLVQVHHYLACTGLARAFVAVLIGGQHFEQFEVERDDELVANLIEVEREFWARVERREPPAPDASESASRALQRLYADFEKDTEIDLPIEASSLLDALRETKRVAAEMKDEDRRLSNALKALLGEAHIGVLDGRKAVTWSRWTQKRLDRDALEADHPDLVARYLVDDPRDRLTLAKEPA